MAFGRFGGFPRSLGGGKPAKKTIHEDLIDYYEPVFDTSEDQLPWLEAYAEASVLQSVWAAGERLKHQLNPTKMLENLPVWEEATQLRPRASDYPSTRRANLAAKMRGFGDNDEGAIYDVCQSIMGTAFVDLVFLDEADVTSYIPGILPGPPGLDWYSNRAHIYVELQQAGLSEDEFSERVNALGRTLEDFLPAWQTWSWFVGTGGGFFCDSSRLNYDGL